MALYIGEAAHLFTLSRRHATSNLLTCVSKLSQLLAANSRSRKLRMYLSGGEVRGEEGKSA
jgi:hypothetical protein